MIKTIETTLWSKPDEQHRVTKIGYEEPLKIFNQLEAFLKEKDLLPDDYFQLSNGFTNNNFNQYGQFVCTVDFGGSEGIYLNIDYLDYSNNCRKHFITGKTLGETVDDYMRMSQICGVCSLMLNGDGSNVEFKKKYECNEDTELFYKNACKEMEEFENNLILQSNKTTEKSYELTIKRDILMTLENKEFSTDDIAVLNSLDKPLDNIYQEWLSNDYSYMEQLEDTVSDCIRNNNVLNTNKTRR